MTNPINTGEKVVLAILSMLGAAYWGFGLWLALLIPAEHPYYGAQPQTGIYMLTMLAGCSLFLIYSVVLFAAWIRTRLLAWGFLTMVIGTDVVLMLLEGAYNHP